MRRPVIFVTDFGRDDAYAAALVGAAWQVDPEAACVEGTHGIPPGDVLGGAYALKSLALAFPRGVVFCAVVDPGVGTNRRAIAVSTAQCCCVCPDNGLVSYLWDEAQPDERHAVALPAAPGASATFHGRDVFAPAAARLAGGASLMSLGTTADDPVTLPEAFAQADGGSLRGAVIAVDHFGNAITSVRERDIGSRAVRRVRWRDVETSSHVRTYAEIAGGVAVLMGSAGHLELAAARGPAAQSGGPRLHDPITVEVV